MKQFEQQQKIKKTTQLRATSSNDSGASGHWVSGQQNIPGGKLEVNRYNENGYVSFTNMKHNLPQAPRLEPKRES